MGKAELRSQSIERIKLWRNDWPLFMKEAFGVFLDDEQVEVLRAIQNSQRVSVVSGTSRGKDFVAAAAAMCFLYLTPEFNTKGELVKNTKVFLTAPTSNQIETILMPGISHLFNKAKTNGFNLPGKLLSDRVSFDPYREWFLKAFKADDNNHEAWTGLHAANIMFVITEATGISDNIFQALEGNLHGNFKILLAFNPNTNLGYAAKSQSSERWTKFRLNCLNAINVTAKEDIIPGQVSYQTIKEFVEDHCLKISKDEIAEAEDDFEFEGQWYRPNDFFRIKVLGKFAKVAEDVLIPPQWVEKAQENWKKFYLGKDPLLTQLPDKLILGVDVAGEGRDSTAYCYRFGNVVRNIHTRNSGGVAEHPQIAGKIINELNVYPKSVASIDTIGEGASVYPLVTQEGGLWGRVYSCKFSYAAKDRDGEGRPLKDHTGQRTFKLMRDYLYWSIRDWLDPRNNNNPCLPPDDRLKEELCEFKWRFLSNGSIQVEGKDEVKKRLGRSPDKSDSLANTFYPIREPIGYITKEMLGVY